MPVSKSLPLLVIGAGTWGSSTALHLARRGYTNVTVLDAYAVPSTISAGNDINKIISTLQNRQGKDEMEAGETLLRKAVAGWTHDPLFQPYYHNTGLVIAACSEAARERLGIRTGLKGDSNLVELSTPEHFQRLAATGVLSGEFPDWRGFLIRSGAGWAHARNALEAAIREASRLGVRFVTGDPEGRVTKLLFEDDDVKGAVAADGTVWRATHTFLCAGAMADGLLDFKQQLRPTAWTLAHIQLELEERALYEGIPVIFNIEKGFFFEPDQERGEIKICDEHPGYTNTVHSADGSVRSIPFERTQIPKESEERVRSLLRETMPQLADRPFSFARICWCADTPNREFIIDRHPEHPSLILGSGASGKGFKFLPSIGDLIVDAMEDKIPPNIHEIVKWDPENATNRNWKDTLGRYGGPNRVMDFQEVTKWTTIEGEMSKRS